MTTGYTPKQAEAAKHHVARAAAKASDALHGMTDAVTDHSLHGDRIQIEESILDLERKLRALIDRRAA